MTNDEREELEGMRKSVVPRLQTGLKRLIELERKDALDKSPIVQAVKAWQECDCDDWFCAHACVALKAGR